MLKVSILEATSYDGFYAFTLGSFFGLPVLALFSFGTSKAILKNNFKEKSNLIWHCILMTIFHFLFIGLCLFDMPQNSDSSSFNYLLIGCYFCLYLYSFLLPILQYLEKPDKENISHSKERPKTLRLKKTRKLIRNLSNDKLSYMQIRSNLFFIISKVSILEASSFPGLYTYFLVSFQKSRIAIGS